MPNVTLKLTLGGSSIGVTGPREHAEKKLEDLANRYLPSVKAASAEGRGVSVAWEKGGKKLSAGESLKKAASKDRNDRALGWGTI